MKNVSKVFKIIAIISAVLLLGSIVLQKRCDKPVPEVAQNEYLLPAEKYTPPLVKIPLLTKDKPPVSKANLPIPKKDVKTTIVVKNPIPGARDITLVIDKEGKIYKSKDTPEDAKIEVTTWKPRLFDVKPRFGYSGVYSDQFYHCLSLDVIRIGKFYAGGEVGISLSGSDIDGYLLGLSGKYHFATLGFVGGGRIDVLATLGWNFLDKRAYAGISIRW
jgi:hypothetical protein